MKRNFSYNTILWIGLFLWIVSAAIRIINVLSGGTSPGQDVIIDALGAFKDIASIIVIILLIGVAIPIAEEFLFRFWIKSKRNITPLLLFFAMGCYVAIGTYWWLGLAAFALCIMLYLLLKKKDINTRCRTEVFCLHLLFSDRQRKIRRESLEREHRHPVRNAFRAHASKRTRMRHHGAVLTVVGYM